MSAPRQAEYLLTEDQVCRLVQMPLRMLREVSRLANLGEERDGTRYYRYGEMEILMEVLEGFNKVLVEQLT